MKFIPKWCPAWWPALLCDSGSWLGPPSAGASGSRVPTSRFATRRSSSLGLAPTLLHTVSLAPVRPKGTNCPGGDCQGPGLTFSFAPPWAEPGALRAVSRWPVPTEARELRRPHHRHRVSEQPARPPSPVPPPSATSRAGGFGPCSQQVGTGCSAARETRLQQTRPWPGYSEAVSAVRREYESLIPAAPSSTVGPRKGRPALWLQVPS